MTHVGIHDGHNASVALVRDGLLAMAVQEERFTRIKNQGDLPECSVAQIDGPIDTVALNGAYMNYGQWRRESILADYRATPSRRWKDAIKGTLLDTAYQHHKARTREKAVTSLPLHAPVASIDHHTAHAATAYYTSPWRNETALVFTCDGSGDRLSASISIGRKGRLERIASISERDSLGRMYSLATFALGLTPLEHEYKVMGLAPYGRNSSLFAGAFELQDGLHWKRHASDRQILERCRNRRFDDVAASAQYEVELLLPVWIRSAICETGIRRVTCAGGVFMNVKANLAILQIPELEELHIAPSCGDESNAIGAAMLTAAASGEPIHAMPPLYFGSTITNDDADAALQGHRLSVRYCRDIESVTAEALARHHIVARARGPMEFGARALGNRSILARTDSSDTVQEINGMIKRRDFWMPFAPTILAERADEYCEKPKAHRSPHMMMTYRVRPARRAPLTAVMHPADCTTRPQELSERDNPDYYRLLKAFELITGVGAVLNTSFNIHGEPIVRSAWDAVEVFLRSGLRHMALGDLWVEKR